MSTKSFFNEQKEQSQIKARIVENYFFKWANIMISTLRKQEKKYSHSQKKKIGYIDLFAGPGRYQDGSESTPIRVLQKAAEDEELRDRLVTLFNDADSNNTHQLEEYIQSIPEVEKLRYKPQVWNQEVGENIVQLFEETRLIPVLFFVDPWGYKGLSLQLINSVVKNWGCDGIFFFNYNRINMGLKNDKVKTHMDALFGEHHANTVREELELATTPSEKELIVVEAISKALQNMGGKYVLPFRFKNEKGNRTSHHLIFVSKHIRGYEKMKETMAKQSSSNNQGVASFEYNPATEKQPLLFELSRPLDDLGEMLTQKFAGQTLSMKEIYEKHHVDTPYTSKNYKTILLKLESEGKIQANLSERNRKRNEFPDKVQVTFLK